VKWLSLTLRDAQHLSWKTFKKFEAIDKKRSATLATTNELGKNALEILTIDQSPLAGNPEQKAKLEKALSQMIFACFVIAERHGVSLEDTFLQSMDDLILGFVS
jgi:hypothetical protein